jgi:hypothetical protein
METPTRNEIMADISEQEEFEFRARAEAEAKAAEDRAKADEEKARAEELKTKAEAQPISPEGVQHYAGEAGDWMMQTGLPHAYQALKVGSDLAEQHPVIASALGYGALAKVAPNLSKWNTIKNIGQGVVDVGQAFTASRNAQALGQLEHQIRQYAKAGQAIPEQLQSAVDALRSRVVGAPPTVEAPIAPAAEAAEAVAQPAAQQVERQGVRQLAGRVGSRVLGAVAPALEAAGPAMMLAMPYQMAAHEQEKIRANPNAAEYKYNPYAMTVRGEAPTQGAAAASNQRRALVNQQYGGLSPEEQQILEQDRINMLMRLKAAKKVLGQE